ncbi:hypothetical protein ACEQ8H_007726 [Pleosporales sp. CAS-2024a]
MAALPAQNENGLKERFYHDFQRNATALREQIDQLSTMPPTGDERSEAIDECLAGIDQLSNNVMDASSYLPAYDQRSYSQKLKDLAEKLQDARKSFNPPKKFSFKTRKNVASPPPNAVESLVASTPNKDTREAGPPQPAEDVADGIEDGPGVRRPSLSHASKVTITNHRHLHVKLPASASHATSSGTVSNLRHCVIDLSAPTMTAPFSALYLRNIKDSLVICGQVAGAVHVTDAENSVIVIATRQFRMHGSRKVDVYLHSASRPIIEDCSEVRFAPMPDMFASAATLQTANHWSEIDDFKWLKVEPSPNFSLLVESERIKEDVWRSEVMDNEHLNHVLEVIRTR